MATLLGNDPALAVDGGRLDGLELILGGLVDPIDGYCLPGRKPAAWPFEATFEVPAELGAAAEATGILVLTDPDGTPIARLTVTGTLPGSGGLSHIAGALSALQPPEHPPARDIRLSRSDVVHSFTMAIFTGEPQLADIAESVVKSSDESLVLLATSWNGGHADYRVSATVDSLRRCAERIPGCSVRFLAMGPLNPTLDAATILAHILGNLRPRRILDFSGSERATSPRETPPPSAEGSVVLLTGLSGSGKSTIARALSERLTAGGRHRPVLLDGDDVRRVLSAGLGFTTEDREQNLRRIGWVAAKIASVGGIAICAPIAPFEHTRREMRAMAEESSRFILIYVATPLEVCEQRDRKGLYARARAGELKDFTGIDSPYEAPSDADLVIDTSTSSIEQNVDSILRLIAPGAAG